LRSSATVIRDVPSTLASPAWYGFGAIASAEFTDTMTISSPTANGTAGTAKFLFRVSGTASGSSASAGLYIKNLDTDQVVFDDAYLTGGDYICTSDPYDFVYGEPFAFMVSFAAFADISGPGAAASHADFSHTATFSGMEVFDALGGRVTDFTTSSASGTRYPVASIPEPGTLALLALGLASLCARKRSA
jgi:hypothetical protein